jgi:hypothetical protein
LVAILAGCGGGGGGNAANEKPVVVAVSPSNGASSVNRNTLEIAVQFNKEMSAGGSVAGETNWPLSSSTPSRWSADHRTFYISRDNAGALLPASTALQLSFNGPNHPLNFKDTSGNALDPYTTTFTTAAGTIGNYTADENGTKSSPWGDGSSAARPAMAVKFTPSSYPVTIKSVSVYVANNSGSDRTFNLYGFSENLAAETKIFTPLQNQVVPETGNSCLERHIPIPETTITSGSFHIAVEWNTKPLSASSGNNSFFLCTDSHLDNFSTNFWRFTGTAWTGTEATAASSGDFGILANY